MFPILHCTVCLFFFVNCPTSTDLYTLSLHDALPIFSSFNIQFCCHFVICRYCLDSLTCFSNSEIFLIDRKSTRLNSSHVAISYAVFCLKKKNKKETIRIVMVSTK